MFFFLLTTLFFLIDFNLKNLIEVTPSEYLPKSFLYGHIKLSRLHNKGLAGGRLKKRPRVATLISGLCLLVVSLTTLPFFSKKGIISANWQSP